ncbi:uncharacterized protein LOC107272600 isoform X2 [Cephus cinctus]|nr:uncharacterized protein LOC107272600 isoform X2 [Cephus cinctus]XP_015605387.1 uncharacterized protein LOC107272600 isoform X2 [Cephus cinctus]XP_024945699.1 uncharacterized protein LOC107272600 isoform X2 [Cephus cinctus]
MKEMITTESTAGFNNHFVTNNGDTGSNSIGAGPNSRRYAVLSTEWIGVIGEELGIHPLPDTLLKRLAEDASYRLREVLHKCMTRLKHSKRKRLTSGDVNAVITTLCDVDPVIGAPERMPEYHSEAKVFIPHDRIVDLAQRVNDPPSIAQVNFPYLQESEVADSRLTDARNSYAKKALKTLFNGSQKTFQVLLNDCATNPQMGGEGVIDKLMSIARSMVISNNAQYTRVSTRTCQLIIVVASNSEAVYPYHLTSVDKLTELLLELLLGQSFINPNLETLFKECALKLMLRWPSVADKYIPVLENALVKKENENSEYVKNRITAMELLAGVQPLTFFQSPSHSVCSPENILLATTRGSTLWQRIAFSVYAFLKADRYYLIQPSIIEHYGDSLLPYIYIKEDRVKQEDRKSVPFPIIMKSKIKYANVKLSLNTKVYGDRQIIFPDSTLRGPRKEIRFAFAGGRPVPSSNLRRASLRANYEILRSDLRASFALVASRRLLVYKNDKKRLPSLYNLVNTHL